MKTNFKDLPDKEIDRLAGEMMTTKKLIDISDHELYPQHYPYHWMFPCDGEYLKWNPTHKDSNQCERWLFPKVCEKAKYNYGNHLSVEQKDEGWSVELRLETDSDPTEDDPFSLPDAIWIRLDCKSFEEINHTKTICCLKAMEEIG